MAKNPNNPTNSSLVQALLDAKDNGFPAVLVNPLLDFADKNKSILKEADAVFKKRNYPKGALRWSRIYNDFEYESFLSTNEFLVLIFMVKNMATNNLIQVSQQDIVSYTTMRSKGAVNSVLHSLISKGCIAVKFQGNNRQKAVYMINPLLGTVGVEHKNSLAKTFWELTGTQFKDKEKDTEHSEPHKKWLELTMEQHYYRGRNSRENISFIEIKEKTKETRTDTKAKKDSVTSKDFSDIDSITDEIIEDLPF